MKPKHVKLLLGLISLAPMSLFGQTVAKTTPVGYITHSIAGAGSGLSAETYISPTMIQADVFAGQSSAAPSGTTINFTSGVPTGLDGTYVLEISTGSSEGWWATVVSSTSTSITVADAFPSGLPTNTKISVRKHHTLGTFLGNNTPNFIDYDGANPSDEVVVFDPVTQNTTSFSFVSAANLGDPAYPNGAWLDLGSGMPANDTIISPGSSVRIKRVGSSAVSFVTSGTVKISKTQVDIYPGYNFVGVPIAANGTLSNTGFPSQLVQWDGASADYDEIQLVPASQATAPYAIVDDSGPQVYDISSGLYANTQSYAEGTGMLLKRTGSPASTITLNGSTVAP